MYTSKGLDMPLRAGPEIGTDRAPMLGLLINDIKNASVESQELLGKLESRLSPIIMQPEPMPPETNMKEPSVAMPPACELLRSVLCRINDTNRQLRNITCRLEV